MEVGDARAGGDGHRRGAGRRRRQRRLLDQLHPGAAAEHPDGAAVVFRRRHLRAGGAHQPGAQRLALHHLRVEQRPEPVPVRRRGHLGGVQRRRVGLPEPRHHAGGAGQGDRRLGRVPQLPGRRRQHRDQVGQQRLPRDAQRLRHPGRLGGQQHAQRAVPLHRALQPAGHLRARRPRSNATACGSTGSSRPIAPGHDRRRRRPEPRARRRQQLQAVPQGHRAPLRERQPVGRLEQQHVLLRRHGQPHGAAQHPDRGARPQPGRLQPVHPDARQRHPDRGPRRRHLHPRQLHALLERLRDARAAPTRPPASAR